MKRFTVEAIMTRLSSLSNKGVSVGFHTKELFSNERSSIMDYDGQQGWLVFSENEIKDEEIPNNYADLEKKTQSQRIRECLYRLYEQRGKTGTFEDFYRMQTEKIINAIKNKLE